MTDILLPILSETSEGFTLTPIVLPVILGLLGIVILYFIVGTKSEAKEKEEETLESLFAGMKSIFKRARLGEITKDEGELYFAKADRVLFLLSQDSSSEESAVIKREIEKMSNQITMLLGLHATNTRAVSLGEEIEKLANLRKQSVISDHEFQAFSERFKLSTGEKASGVIKAISELHEQHRNGAVSEGNYHAALWSLLDKLDRKT